MIFGHKTAFAALAAMAMAVPLAAVAPASAAGAPPVLAYTNLGFHGAYNTSAYYFVSGPVNTALTYAAPFVAGASGPLDYIDLPLHGDPVVVSIYPDVNGVPGTYSDGPPLEEWLDEKPNAAPGKTIRFVSKAHPTLTAGTQYWVVAAPLFYNSEIFWYENSTGVTGVDATYQGGWANTWAPYTVNANVMPAFDVWVQ